MKIVIFAASFVMTLSFYAAIAQQTTPVGCPTNPYPTTCPQTNWATAYVVNEAGNATVTTLLPDTRYNVVVEALPTVAPCSAIIVITNIDGATDWNGTPYSGNFGGVDVPRSYYPYPGRPYKVNLGFRTPTLASGEFVSQVYVKYRMECSVSQGTGTVGGGTRVPSSQKQTLVP